MKTFIVLFFVALIVLAWCPWLSQEKVLAIINTAVQTEQSSSLAQKNECTLSANQSVQQTVFGYTGTVSYKCNLGNLGPYEGDGTVFVTPFSTVIGMPDLSSNS